MRWITILIALFAFICTAAAGDDIIVKRSSHSVSATLDKLTEVLESKGITVFERIDHSAGAKKAGLSLRPTELLIFGNPKLGTPLMQSDQKVGLDLPMKALAWEDEKGAVWLGYTLPGALKNRYKIGERDPVLKKMTGALDKLTSAAVK